jgi:Ca-activated chloride channel homolog
LKGIAAATGGSYHPASDVAELSHVADSIDLRLTVAKKPVALAGAFSGVAVLLLGLGSLLTLLRTGRLI